MVRFIFIFYAGSLMFSHWAWGSCAELKGQLVSMQKAQVQISENLVNNYKEATEEGLDGSQDFRKKVLFQAHQRRALKTEGILKKLNQASADLIEKIAKCL